MTEVTLDSMRRRAATIGGERAVWLAEHADAMSDTLASLYRTQPMEIAELCDEHLDRSGGLLGMVRHKAAMVRST